MKECQHEWEEFISGRREEWGSGPFHVKRYLRCKKCGAEEVIANGIIKRETKGYWKVYGLEEEEEPWGPAFTE